MEELNRIYVIMKSKKMQQSLVAKAAGFDPKLFNAILKGRKILRPEYVAPICNALEITPDILFGYKSDDGKHLG